MSNFNSLFQTVDALDSRCVYAFTNTNNSRTFENQTYILHILAIRWEAQYRMEAQYRFPMRMTLFKSAITLMSLFKSAISLEKRNLKRLGAMLTQTAPTKTKFLKLTSWLGWFRMVFGRVRRLRTQANHCARTRSNFRTRPASPRG